jgi:hypothetical protein
MSAEPANDEYLAKRFDEQQKWYSNKAADNKKKFHASQVIIIVAGSLIPLISALGVNTALQSSMAMISALLGGIIVITTALIQMFKYQENWIIYRTTSELLKKEKYFYLNDVGVYSDLSARQKKKLFVETIENLVSSETSKYFTVHKPNKSEPQVISICESKSD